MKTKEKIIYYKDPLNDDFANNKIKTKNIPQNYNYIKSRPRTFFANLFYYLVFPVVYIIQKIVYGEKYVGKKKLNPYKKTGFFMFGNHTRAMGDAYSPSIIAFPKKAYIICNPDAVSIPFVSRITKDLGAIPVPAQNDFYNLKKLFKAVELHAQKKHVITIFPEAHIWPFCTKIRPFLSTSFKYAVKFNKPVFCFTTTYSKRRFLKTPKTTVYIDGPFFCDSALTDAENQEFLRNQVYNAMLSHSSQNTAEFIKYIKQE